MRSNQGVVNMDIQFFQTSKLWLPSYLARNLEKVLNAETPEESCRSMRDVFSLLVRTVTISLVSQYLFQKKDRVQDDNLNHMLANNLPELSMDACLQLLFASVNALGNEPQNFFIQEIYELYWDTSSGEPKASEENLLRQMVQILSIVKDDELASNNHVDWDKLNQECSDLLVKILKKFCFLQNYELIRVVGTGNSFWEVEVYKGMEVELSKVSGSGVSLQEGWFYWHHVETKTFLRLNPFLVFWQDVVTGKDVAVFEAYVPERLQYLLTQLGKIVVVNAGEKEFEKLMDEIIREAGSKPQEVKALEWEQLRKVCMRISQYGMGRNLHKYNPDLYVQRWHVFESFEKFLASDKKIFVLVGNSGTGKSSFVLSLAEALKKNDNICTISYDGKQLKVEPSIQNAIAKDFNKFVMIDGEKSNDLWIEIGKVKGIENKQIVLFVDGINENTYPKELLGQLYQLANLNWSWLKIVLTCRPETWQKILTRQNMDEKLYYQEQDRNPTGGDRSFSIKLEAFSKNELEDVYEKYKRKYDLKTDLRDIKGRVQEILRDPFNLWLVSSTHQHQEIPDGLVVSDLVKVYVESLLKSGVLREKDIEFLKEELVPLFFESDSRIVNELSREEIKGEDFKREERNRENLRRNDSKEEEYLYDRIRGEGVSSEGEPKTKSFTNLTDAHILLMDNEDLDWKIKFTHERFFEYFVGEQISRLSISRKDLVNYFQNLVIRTNQLTFLWGAVKHALVIEMGGPSLDTILKLCYTTEQRVKEMMVAVIIDFGSENLSKTEAFLEQLLPVSKQTGSLKRGQLILRRASLTYDIRNRNAQKIAVEAASKLQLAWVLQTGAVQKDPAVRTSAVRYGYYLWQQNPNEGYKILRQISKDALPGIIPNLVAFESFVVFSLVIFIDHFKNDEVLNQLRSIWSRNLIAKLFIRNESDGFVKRKLQAFVRELLFFNAIKMVMTIIKEFPQYAKAVNYSFIDAFFHLETREKELYKKLVGYLNAESDYSTEQMKADYLAAIKTQCLLFQGVVILGLSVHALQNPGEFLPFLKHFFSEAEKDTPENIWVASIPTVLMTVLDQNAREKEYFEFFVQTAAKCQVFYTKHTPEAYYLGPYVLYQYLRTGNAETDWLKTRIEAQLKSNNLSFFDALINSELVIVGIEKYEPIAVLQVLGLFFAQSTPEIKQIIQTFLTRLKIYYPNEVDNFLEEQKVPDDFRLSVRANETTETLGALIGGTKVWNFFLNVLSESSGFQKHLIHLFDKAANFSDAKKWIEYTIRYLFNLVFGG